MVTSLRNRINISTLITCRLSVVYITNTVPMVLLPYELLVGMTDVLYGSPSKCKRHQILRHLLLQVLGNAKGAVAVVVSILIFRNPVSIIGMLGYTLTVFGVILYSEAKKRSK